MAMRPPTTAASAAGIAEVDRLLLKLEKNLADAKLSLKQQEELLGKVKVLGRSVDTAGPIFAPRGITALANYGFDRSDAPDASHEALRCLANAFLLNESCRQTFVDLGYAPKAAARLRVDNRDDEFLVSRILFLLTYNTKADFRALINDQQLDESINDHVARHARAFPQAGRSESTSSPMQDMSMVETLKLMFNITYYYPDEAPRFTPSIKPLLHIILHYPLQTQPLQPPVTYMFNALLNLDLQVADHLTSKERETATSPLFAGSNPESVVERFASILDGAIRNQPEEELDQAAAPLCTLLRRSFELATPQMKFWMRGLLLPTSKDREKPLGQGDTLSARLLRLSCSPKLPTLRENISSLLFELSDKDANKFIKNIGYGFASGFLMSHNIAIPGDAMKAGDAYAESGPDFNPITGQRLSAEEASAPKADEMTEEEKEREAEKLFVLFERLKATGVMNVKNPVEQAIDEGRFEELED